jgi:hypothetical protein
VEERSELDELAFQMESAVDRFIGDQNASQNFVLMKFAADQSTGAYPQAKRESDKEFFENTGDAYLDRLPVALHEPISLKLAPSAKWTDVLSSDLWSEGYLVNEKTLGIFEQFDLGLAGKYQVEVQSRKDKKAYTYVFFANHVTVEDIDFGKSEFYVADMLGSPKHLIKIASQEEFQVKRQQAFEGKLEDHKKFSRVTFKKMQLKPERVPKAAVFGIGTLGTELYIRRDLYESLRNAKVSGLEFKRNNKLFD